MGCETDSFEDDLADLSSLRTFSTTRHSLRCADSPGQPLHILQRYHDYLAKQEVGKAPEYVAWRGWLLRAYEDFVGSSAQQEKVFAVFQRPTVRPSCRCLR